jgi:hypothetical protein
MHKHLLILILLLQTSLFSISNSPGSEIKVSEIQGIEYVAGKSGIDSSTETLQTIEYEHHEIHSGSHFFICGTQALSNSEVVNFTFITPNTTKWTHMTFVIEGTGAISLEIFEGATVNVAGTAVTARNSDRNSETTTVNTIRTGDTYTGTGTSIYSKQTGALKSIGIISRNNEIILKQNTTYIFRITNETAVANQLTYCADWYEHQSKN